ncbi:MAG: lipocalin-like domain-containing protein, partial [Chlorobi bacterium]|nr:lipocalin-like domain-containing protein [Chlorobiota bacterium]
IRHVHHKIYPFGKEVKGILIYGKEYMSVQIMMPVHFPISETRKHQLKLEDLAQTLNRYMGYFGSYEIDEANHIVIHHVKGAIAQKLTAGEEIRNFKFKDEKLVLSKGPLELTWSRV